MRTGALTEYLSASVPTQRTNAATTNGDTSFLSLAFIGVSRNTSVLCDGSGQDDKGWNVPHLVQDQNKLHTLIVQGCFD